MGRNLEKTCDVCCKTMRGDNLKRHMKHHDKEPYPKFIYDENSQFGLCAQIVQSSFYSHKNATQN